LNSLPTVATARADFNSCRAHDLARLIDPAAVPAARAADASSRFTYFETSSRFIVVSGPRRQSPQTDDRVRDTEPVRVVRPARAGRAWGCVLIAQVRAVDKRRQVPSVDPQSRTGTCRGHGAQRRRPATVVLSQCIRSHWPQHPTRQRNPLSWRTRLWGDQSWIGRRAGATFTVSMP
jgi:hypothetical protein